MTYDSSKDPSGVIGAFAERPVYLDTYPIDGSLPPPIDLRSEFFADLQHTVYAPNIATTGQNNVDDATVVFGQDLPPGSTVTSEIVDLAVYRSGRPWVQDALDDGFTFGWHNTNLNTIPGTQGKMWYGGEAPTASGGHTVVGEISIITDTPFNFGFPRIVLFDENRAVIGQYILPVADRVIHNAYYATYVGPALIPSGAQVFEIAVGTSADTIKLYDDDGNVIGDTGIYPDLTVFGERYNVSPNGLPLLPGDWGGSNRELDAERMVGKATGLKRSLLPSVWYGCEGRPQTIYVPSLCELRTRGFDGNLRWERRSTSDGSPPVNLRNPWLIDFNPDAVADGSTIVASMRAETRGNDAFREQVSMTFRKAKRVDVLGTVVKLLVIGDSKFDNNGDGHALNRAAQDMGFTIDFIGTVNNDERTSDNPVATTGELLTTEARGGWRLSDFSCEGGDPTATATTRIPLAAGQEAAYAAGDDSYRHKRNPFARIVDPGTDSAYVQLHSYKAATVANTAAKNYYAEVLAGNAPVAADYKTFDVNTYLNRFSATSIGTIPTPDGIIIAALTNDISDFYNGTNSLDPIGYITRGLESVLHNLFVRLPNVPVGIAVPSCGNTRTGKLRWVLQAAAIVAVLNFVKQWKVNFPAHNVNIISMYATTDPDAIYLSHADTPDEETNSVLTQSVEVVHAWEGASREQEGEALLGWLANEVVKPMAVPATKVAATPSALVAEIDFTEFGGIEGDASATAANTIALGKALAVCSLAKCKLVFQRRTTGVFHMGAAPGTVVDALLHNCPSVSYPHIDIEGRGGAIFRCQQYVTAYAAANFSNQALSRCFLKADVSVGSDYLPGSLFRMRGISIDGGFDDRTVIHGKTGPDVETQVPIEIVGYETWDIQFDDIIHCYSHRNNQIETAALAGTAWTCDNAMACRVGPFLVWKCGPNSAWDFILGPTWREGPFITDSNSRSVGAYDYYNDWEGLPGVATIALGGSAITGATPGTYALTPVGGDITLTPPTADLIVIDATHAWIHITNHGIGTGLTVPTFAKPAGATLPAGTTITATTGMLVVPWSVSSPLNHNGMKQTDGPASSIVYVGEEPRCEYADIIMRSSSPLCRGSNPNIAWQGHLEFENWEPYEGVLPTAGVDTTDSSDLACGQGPDIGGEINGRPSKSAHIKLRAKGLHRYSVTAQRRAGNEIARIDWDIDVDGCWRGPNTENVTLQEGEIRINNPIDYIGDGNYGYALYAKSCQTVNVRIVATGAATAAVSTGNSVLRRSQMGVWFTLCNTATLALGGIFDFAKGAVWFNTSTSETDAIGTIRILPCNIAPSVYATPNDAGKIFRFGHSSALHILRADLRGVLINGASAITVTGVLNFATMQSDMQWIDIGDPGDTLVSSAALGGVRFYSGDGSSAQQGVRSMIGARVGRDANGRGSYLFGQTSYLNGALVDAWYTYEQGELATLSGRIKKLRTVIVNGGAMTVTVTDHVVVINKTVGGASAVLLPAVAAPDTGREYVIKDGKGDAAANNITITPAAGTIDGAATLVMATNYQSVKLVYSGTEWNQV